MQSALGARFTVLSCIGCSSMDLERSCVGSTEGLKQEFNPLDAQREVCEAFIRSQKSAGRIALSDLYDDGGISARRWSDLHSNACSPTFPITGGQGGRQPLLFHPGLQAELSRFRDHHGDPAGPPAARVDRQPPDADWQARIGMGGSAAPAGSQLVPPVPPIPAAN